MAAEQDSIGQRIMAVAGFAGVVLVIWLAVSGRWVQLLPDEQVLPGGVQQAGLFSRHAPAPVSSHWWEQGGGSPSVAPTGVMESGLNPQL